VRACVTQSASTRLVEFSLSLGLGMCSLLWGEIKERASIYICAFVFRTGTSDCSRVWEMGRA
jgi:hypothetical protein